MAAAIADGIDSRCGIDCAPLLSQQQICQHRTEVSAPSLDRRARPIFPSSSAATSTLVRVVAVSLRCCLAPEGTSEPSPTSHASPPASIHAGKSTTTGRLIFELGGIPERELEKLKAEADALGKSSFAFAFYMDTQKEERARGVTISCTTKEFFTEKWHYTIIDAPGA